MEKIILNLEDGKVLELVILTKKNSFTKNVYFY